ncbi:hypothetical protein B7P43_G05371 [Cryptotermes secundus]|uniref:Uncharacterized protein n=1 Tax=Cryptotermes secundus TaxID=105785 RepID=A0A2J7PES7_9NEOP|nr:hypothetical protein B7P43_G05371 [Cryptotermes secundus]
MHTALTYMKTPVDIFGPTCSSTAMSTDNQEFASTHIISPCCFMCTNNHEYHPEIVNNTSKMQIYGSGIKVKSNMNGLKEKS